MRATMEPNLLGSFLMCSSHSPVSCAPNSYVRSGENQQKEYLKLQDDHVY